MSINTPGTNRYSKFLEGTYRNSQWYCVCNEKAKRVQTGKGINKGKDFYKCDLDGKCGFWLWVEHEPEARRSLAASMSPEPQTPSRPRQISIESRSELGVSTGLNNTLLRNSNSTASDRVLRSSQQAASTSTQANRFSPRPPTPDDENELATRVINLLKGYDIQLSSKVRRRLYVLVEDYVNDMEVELSLCKVKLED